ncbi:MAG: DUF2846 domain-containing protein [Acidiferrobacterales bacterium]
MKNKLVRMLMLAASVLLMTGCATTLGPQFESVTTIPSGKALIYIYRTPQFVGSGVAFDIHHDDKVVTRLVSGGYYPYITDPGVIRLWAKTEAESSVTLYMRSGETRYVKGAIGIGFFMGRPKLDVVDNVTGAKEIAECKLIPEKGQ